MITKTCGGLEYLTAENITAAHGFTTRLGGISQGHLSSLNLGTTRGDDPENVRENYRRLGAALGFAPENLVMARQVHSDIVYQVTEKDRGAGLYAPRLPECDALITDVPGLALIAFTADCTPILLHDPVTGAVAAIHAGWRGTVASIAAKTVAAMEKTYGSRPADIRGAIGPNIGFCHFETHQDVPDAVRAAFGTQMDAYIVKDGEKYRLDLKKINAAILKKAGVESIDLSKDCTVCQHERFWSFRVVGDRRGSQGAVIVCGGKGL